MKKLFLISFIFGFFFCFAGFLLNRSESAQNAYSSWVETTARLDNFYVTSERTSSNIGTKTSTTSSIYHLEYTYKVSNLEYKGATVTTGSITALNSQKLSIGCQIKVKYNPSAPQLSVALPDEFPIKGKSILYAGIALLSIGILGLFYVLMRKKIS